MRATIKSIEFIEENEKKGFLVKLDTEDGEKAFGGFAGPISFRELFFGLLSICDNFDISDLAKVKGEKVSCLLEGPSNIEKRIVSVGRGRNFLVYDKVKGFITKTFSEKEIDALRESDDIAEGSILEITSSQLAIFMPLKFKGYFQSFYSPQIFNGMGYPLVSEELSDDKLMETCLLSMQYIKEFMQTILGTTYLYDEEENKTRYEVECYFDEFGNVVSVGKNSCIDGSVMPVFINKCGESYYLNNEPLVRKTMDNIGLKLGY